ncbi:TetR/AcrR family transcriptional regulator [Roseibium sp.]|uniref:TetR/AcrR family transcriptional regulator n=1 Tax=Roseibium sp. TaxID=1936156 RepID=UPI00391B5249
MVISKSIVTFVPVETTKLLEDLVANRDVPRSAPWRSKGMETKRNILNAALDLFISSPIEEFTMRRLTANVGMELGNLTYHYRSKARLIDSMVKDRTADYAEEILAVLARVEASPRDALETTITLLVQDLRRPEIAFFPKLWALSLHDDNVAAATAHIHEIERQVFAGLVRATRPDWDLDACDALALHITASIEGLTLFIGQNRRKTEIYEAPEQEIIRVLRKAL